MQAMVGCNQKHVMTMAVTNSGARRELAKERSRYSVAYLNDWNDNKITYHATDILRVHGRITCT